MTVSLHTITRCDDHAFRPAARTKAGSPTTRAPENTADTPARHGQVCPSGSSITGVSGPCKRGVLSAARYIFEQDKDQRPQQDETGPTDQTHRAMASAINNSEGERSHQLEGFCGCCIRVCIVANKGPHAQHQQNVRPCSTPQRLPKPIPGT